MNRKKMTVFVVSAAVLIMFVIFVGFYLSLHTPAPAIVLPPEPSSEEPGQPHQTDRPAMIDEGFRAAEISPEDLGAILRAMEKTTVYTSEIEISLFWEGASSTTLQRAYVGEGRIKLERLGTDGAPVEHTVIDGGTAYVWGEGDAEAETLPMGEMTAENILFIPAYELLMALDPDSYLDASYAVFEDTPTVRFALEDAVTGYVKTYWVDLEHGLLLCAETEKEGGLIYRMRRTSLLEGQPEDTVFALPG
ncbi:hypothetical protein LJC32_00410 [Oscillospiraceae bacterium OttesenSCG-928-F05]|nr:hypothetical protein [Oscillospiraceae bacterium OttesenSCG-928-F05]